MQRTFEEILREKMAVPVSIKGKDATVLPMEAMVLSVMNDAMRGNIAAILFIRSLTERNTGTDEDYLKQRRQMLADTIAETMDTPTHRPVTITPQKDGSDRTELSPTNRIFNDLYRQWRKDWQELRQQIVQRQMNKRMMQGRK